MTSNQYRKAIEQLGLSQERAGLFFGYSARQSQRWAMGEASVPNAVAILLRLLLQGKITMADIEAARDSEKAAGESISEC
jgi:hypothetical protein